MATQSSACEIIITTTTAAAAAATTAIMKVLRRLIPRFLCGQRALQVCLLNRLSRVANALWMGCCPLNQCPRPPNGHQPTTIGHRPSTIDHRPSPLSSAHQSSPIVCSCVGLFVCLLCLSVCLSVWWLDGWSVRSIGWLVSSVGRLVGQVGRSVGRSVGWLVAGHFLLSSCVCCRVRSLAPTHPPTHPPSQGLSQSVSQSVRDSVSQSTQGG